MTTDKEAERIAAQPKRFRCFICQEAPAVRVEGENRWPCANCNTEFFIDDAGTWAARDKPKSPSLFARIRTILQKGETQ